ncbi:hypothetical protein EMIHUDRAFT_226314 [Emiliania huxleyi CCMP1516]|uniref:Plastocyanin-like domain-containing protein n=2 Tax=Emiliania huxleyi TaxID=2903 RepID=A0A0D3IX95_EMIH1|nr:hypothetical protein EMIHUDRAFT_245486 [Emiliania huxleyi CCMP1516]XP_005788966.1 hypothetical protein EMIHUDRAFT_226314 [Emiliania huxleyi CCMP1516]EOD15880.1 hypothetical protein EMIHUDRAFT_245486 [Emiliania huxleyi CCMP1516]EOD36537.1 hypothetical protein EMIHUDRAFT_226314 [Emiliania huxleyi CCMP1516]|eukprot:XP_005768309.1 hypothetical protein EMIHUDRAFT_245486 [Emiliania huxleyi CCMP1516]
MCSVVVRQEAFPMANVPAALLFEQHLLSAESQAYIHSFRDHGHDGQLWFPRAVDNIGHPLYPPYPGEDPDGANFTVTSLPGRGMDVTLSVDAARFAGSPLHMTTRCYNGSFPGPVLRVRRGDHVQIHLVNNLLASGGHGDDLNRTNLHLHGMHVPATPYEQASNSCGDNLRCIVEPQHTITYRHRVDDDHPSGTFWYHPHPHGTSALQVGGLMAGMLIVEDEPEETPLAAMVEVLLVLQMQHWHSLGVATHDTIHAQLHDALDMDVSGGPPANYILANGQFKPSVSLLANQYTRFRVLNANAVATFELELTRGSHCSMDVLAMDGVYLARPARVTHALEDLRLGTPDETSTITLGDGPNSDAYQITINGHVYNDSSPGNTQEIRLGALQEWRIRVGGASMHPFHAHRIHFLVVSVDGPAEYGALVGVGQWRDTIPIPATNSGAVIVTVRFRAQRHCGDLPFHCHILHHSDLGMAARLAVVGTAASKCLQPAVDTAASQYCGRGTHWCAEAQRCIADLLTDHVLSRAVSVLLLLVTLPLSQCGIYWMPT